MDTPACTAAVLYAAGELRIESRERPAPGPHEVLVAVSTVGVCGSDVHYYRHGRIGQYVVRAPLVLGHEAAGVVVGLGPHAARHSLGQRVAMEPGVPCGRCRQCRAGRYNLCPHVRFFATPPVDGAFISYLTIHEDFAYAVPDGLSDDAAALIEPFSVGLWACRKAGVRPGEAVLITGAGPVGLVALQAARCFGASDVTVSDVNPHRLELARQLGASRTVDVRTQPLTEAGQTVDVLLECSGIPSAVADGVRALAPAGRAVLVGMGSDELPLPVATIQSRELTVTGTFRYAGTYPAAIALAAAGRVDLDAVVTGHYPLDRTEDALRAGETDPKAIKVMVTPAAGG